VSRLGEDATVDRSGSMTLLGSGGDGSYSADGSSTIEVWSDPLPPQHFSQHASECPTCSHAGHAAPALGAAPGSSSHAMDLAMVMRASQAFSVEPRLDVLLAQLMVVVLQQSAATRGVLLLVDSAGEWTVELQSSIDQIYSLQARSHGRQQQPAQQQAQQQAEQPTSSRQDFSALSISDVMPLSVFQYVLNTRDRLLLSAQDLTETADNAFKDVFVCPTNLSAQANKEAVAGSSIDSLTSVGDPPSSSKQLVSSPSAAAAGGHPPKSVLCLPMIKGGVLIGLLYLENMHQDMSVTLTMQHLQVLQLLLSQAALSIENARFTQQLQDRNLQLLAEVVQRQRAEEDMRHAKDLAEASAQSKSAFLSNMSHEIRTPMNCVLGMSRLLTDTELNDEQQQYVSMILSSGRLLLAIINDVLDFSRIESGQLVLESQSIVLLDCIESTLHLCSDMAHQKQLELVYVLDPQAPAVVLGDATHLQQILYVQRIARMTWTHAASGVWSAAMCG